VIVFRDLGGEFAFVRVGRILHRVHDFRFEVLTFLGKLFDALGVGAFHVGKAFLGRAGFFEGAADFDLVIFFAAGFFAFAAGFFFVDFFFLAIEEVYHRQIHQLNRTNF
jgi:hypothetical protein